MLLPQELPQAFLWPTPAPKVCSSTPEIRRLFSLEQRIMWPRHFLYLYSQSNARILQALLLMCSIISGIQTIFTTTPTGQRTEILSQDSQFFLHNQFCVMWTQLMKQSLTPLWLLLAEKTFHLNWPIEWLCSFRTQKLFKFYWNHSLID